MAAKPRRGEVYWVDFEPARGVEQAGRRPALVIQNDRGNSSSASTVIAAISSRMPTREYPFTVSLKAGDGGLKKAGHVNCAQLMTVDQGRLGPRIGMLDPALMVRIEAALRYELGI